MKKKILIYSIIPLIIDQVVKLVVSSNMSSGDTYTLIPNIFNLTYTTNTGGAFNILSDNVFILIVISIILLLFIIKYMDSFLLNKRNSLGFILIYGGLVGNLIDRIFNGYVIDYLECKIISFPIFNLADVFIVVGVLLLVIGIIKGEDENESN